MPATKTASSAIATSAVPAAREEARGLARRLGAALLEHGPEVAAVLVFLAGLGVLIEAWLVDYSRFLLAVGLLGAAFVLTLQTAWRRAWRRDVLLVGAATLAFVLAGVIVNLIAYARMPAPLAALQPGVPAVDRIVGESEYDLLRDLRWLILPLIALAPAPLYRLRGSILAVLIGLTTASALVAYYQAAYHVDPFSGVALWRVNAGGAEVAVRARGTFNHPLTFAGVATIVGVFAVAAALYQRCWRAWSRALTALAALVILGALAVTVSKGYLLVGGACLLGLGLTLKGRWLLAGGVLLAVAALGATFVGAVRARFDNILPSVILPLQAEAPAVRASRRAARPAAGRRHDPRVEVGLAFGRSSPAPRPPAATPGTAAWDPHGVVPPGYAKPAPPGKPASKFEIDRVARYVFGSKIVARYPLFGIGRAHYFPDPTNRRRFQWAYWEAMKLQMGDWPRRAENTILGYHAHNAYLQFAIEGGLFYLVAFLAFMLVVVRVLGGRIVAAVRAGDGTLGLPLAALSALAVILGGALFEQTFNTTELHISLWWLIGVALWPAPAPRRTDSSLPAPATKPTGCKPTGLVRRDLSARR